MQRIDRDGNYTAFPGVTVIAGIGDKHISFWQSVYHFLSQSELICKYYKPLPYESYHMTTCNLYTKEQHPNDWPAIITRKRSFLQKIHAVLSEMLLTPKVSIDYISIPEVLQLYVSLPAEQEELIKAIAREFELEEYVPTSFHITLAYEYNPIVDQEAYDAIKNECANLLHICQKEGNIILDGPKLSFFNSMVKFIPWDGRANPFIEHTTNQAGFFRTPQLSSFVDTISSCFSCKFF